MVNSVYSGGLRGVEGYVVEVEADVSDGLPGFHMVGYLSSEVREAEERVRTAMKNSGYRLAAKKVTVNLSPANVRKEGTACDLAVAVAVLVSYGVIEPSVLRDSAFFGELGLDGRIKPVRGVLPLVMAMREAGMRRCFLPVENLAEGLAVESIGIVRVTDLRSLTDQLNRQEIVLEEAVNDIRKETSSCRVDFCEVNGQLLLRRAAEVAVAGMHNLLLIGPPGSGKSMISKRIPTIMPELSKEEQLEISKVYSICGLLPPGQALLSARPFRAPHHTISSQALMGGGRVPRPGEISLASTGVLFLDELAEYQKQTLETLRQPMEDKKVTISRIYGSFDFPAHFMLAAATNPCLCGYYPDRSRCSCTKQQIRRYLGRISRPLLDRIDICVEAAPVTYEEIRECRKNESSAAIRQRIEQVRLVQEKRFGGTGIHFNSEMGNRQIQEYCQLSLEDEQYFCTIYKTMRLSARGCHKILKVARTIADLEGQERISRRHLGEAVGYRDLEEKYWGREEEV